MVTKSKNPKKNNLSLVYTERHILKTTMNAEDLIKTNESTSNQQSVKKHQVASLLIGAPTSLDTGYPS